MSQKSEPKKKPTDPELRNEGEGSRSATRRYDQAAEQAAKDPEHVKKAAQEAAEALKGPEGKGLREAEERGKKHQHR
jgi:hypothetical protein